MAVALEQVDDGEVRRGLAVGHRGALQHPPALGVVGVDELIDQARLAHPGLADQRHHLAVPRPGLLPGPAVSAASSCCRPTKRREAPRRRCLQAPPDGTGPDQLKDLDGLGQPLDRHRPQGGDLHQALHQPQRRGRQQNGARRGQLFHARRQMRRLAHRRVVHVQVVANRAHHDFPGVEPHAHLHLQALGAAHLLGVARASRPAWPGPHSRRARRGPRGRSAPKEGHDAIAHDLVHRAFIAVHGVHHALQGRIEELPGLFRVEVGISSSSP